MPLEKEHLEKTDLIVKIISGIVGTALLIGGFYFTYIRNPSQISPPSVAMPASLPPAVPPGNKADKNTDDNTTGSITPKQATKPKPKPKQEPEASPTLLDWLKRQFEPEPLRDKYTRD